MIEQMEYYYQQLKSAIEHVDDKKYALGLNEFNTFLKTTTYTTEDLPVLLAYREKINELFAWMQKDNKESLDFLVAQRGKLQTAQKYSQF